MKDQTSKSIDIEITSGKWEFSETTGSDGRYEATVSSGAVTIAVLEDDLEEHRGNGHLIAEAGTVANETGMTPRQLADERNELLDAVKKLAAIIGPPEKDTWATDDEINLAWTLSQAAIAKAERKEVN